MKGEKEEKDSKKSPKKKELLLKIPKKNSDAKQILFREKLSKLLDPQNTELITTKGQLISKCLFGVIVWTKIATKILSGFLL